jgi:hypothetical protein
MQDNLPTLVVANKMPTASTLPRFLNVQLKETVVLAISATQYSLAPQTDRPMFPPPTINSADLGFPPSTI